SALSLPCCSTISNQRTCWARTGSKEKRSLPGSTQSGSRLGSKITAWVNFGRRTSSGAGQRRNSMPRVLIHVEGEAEETFVNEVLAPHLYATGYHKVSARLVGNARLRDRRGGIRIWGAVRKDILRHLKEDPDSLATTMVDYYGLPKTGSRAWPGREAAGRLPFAQKAATVENALAADIC